MKINDNALAWIALMLFIVLMGYTVNVANAGEEYHAKIKPINIAAIDTAKVINVAISNSSPQPVLPNKRSSISKRRLIN